MRRIFQSCLCSVLLVHCGSSTGGVDAGGPAAATVVANVTLQIKNPDPNATGTSKAVALPADISASKATTTKANLDSCTLAVTGAGMSDVTSTFSVASGTSPSVSLTIPAGSSRLFKGACTASSGTTNNIPIGHDFSATVDVTSATSTISLPTQFKNLISSSGSVLNYIRLNQENSTQTKLTIGFQSALTATQKANMSAIVEFDTGGSRTSLGTIDSSQTNGFVTGSKATPYIQITGAASAPTGYLYNTSGSKTMKLKCAWGTNSSSNTEIACTFGITQFKNNINSSEAGQYAGIASLTGASPWEAAPSGGKYAKYDQSANTNTADVSSLISNGSTCDSSRSGETCSAGNCASDDGSAYTCQTPALVGYGATCSAKSDCVSSFCASTSVCLSSTAKTLGNVVTNFAGPAAGTTTSGSTDDTTSGDGHLAKFKSPGGLCLTPDGTTMYVMDYSNYIIRKVTGVGTSSISVTTFAGTVGSAAITNGTGTAAQFSSPSACAIDPTKPDIMYVTDTNSVRKIVLSSAVVSTFAGSTTGAAGSADGTGTAASFSFSIVSPHGIVVDHGGKNLYIPDTSNNSVRQIVISSQAVTTLVPASAGLFDPTGITIDSDDKNLYVTDASNNLVRKVVIGTTGIGTVTTLAGSGAAASTDGTGTAAAFVSPRGIVIDPTDTNIYVSEVSAFANKIRKIVKATGVVTTVAGAGLGDANGTGTAATFNTPQLIILDPTGSTLYIPDQYNNKIRQIQ